MPKQRLRTQQPQSDVRGASPVLKRVRVRKVVGAGTIVDKRDDNLAAFQWNDLGIFAGADDRVVSHDGRTVTDGAKERMTVAWRVGKVLPRLPCLTVVLGTFEGEYARSRRVGHLDKHVGDVKLLSETDR